MLDSLRSNPTVRGLAALYTGTFLSGAWAIIIPTIPVLAREFGVSAGGAAQVVTAFALGKFVGTAIVELYWIAWELGSLWWVAPWRRAARH